MFPLSGLDLVLFCGGRRGGTTKAITFRGEGRNYRYSVSERKSYMFSMGKEKSSNLEGEKGDLDPCPTTCLRFLYELL